MYFEVFKNYHTVPKWEKRQEAEKEGSKIILSPNALCHIKWKKGPFSLNSVTKNCKRTLLGIRLTALKCIQYYQLICFQTF